MQGNIPFSLLSCTFLFEACYGGHYDITQRVAYIRVMISGIGNFRSFFISVNKILFRYC